MDWKLVISSILRRLRNYTLHVERVLRTVNDAHDTECIQRRFSSMPLFSSEKREVFHSFRETPKSSRARRRVKNDDVFHRAFRVIVVARQNPSSAHVGVYESRVIRVRSVFVPISIWALAGRKT